MSNKFEQLLELLINEENDKAEQLFHEIVVEKSRDIYENLADEEVTAEAKEELAQLIEENKQKELEEKAAQEALEEKLAKEAEEALENLNELVEILNNEFIKKPSQEWLKIFDENGLPCGPINSITDMFKDPQTIEREMIIEVNNKKAGPSKAVGMPIKFSKSKTEKSKGAPDLGEHTREIMQNFGYKDEEIDDFYNKKIIL